MALISRSSRRFVPRLVDYSYDELKVVRRPIRTRFVSKSTDIRPGLAQTERRNSGDHRR